MSDSTSSSAFERLMTVLKVGVLVVSVAAAIPTARNLYYSYQNDVPYSQVPHRLAQYDLWMKNLDCRINYRALLTGSGTKVDVGACPKSGDIAIKVSDSSGKATYEWIAYDNLQKPVSQSSSHALGWLVTAAVAAEGNADQSYAGDDSRPMQLAQAALEVKCQARSGTDVIRVVQDGGKCYREVVSPLKGTVSPRQEVPCDTQCTPG